MKTSEELFLENYDINQYDRPSIAADIAVFSIGEREKQEENYRKLRENKLKILLIKRGMEPFKGEWALPGGFVQKGENVYEAARRELKEETYIDNAYIEMCDVFSDKGRDPRGWIISQTFMALVERCKESFSLQAGGDAREAGWFDIDLKVVSENVKQIDDKSFESVRVYELILENSVKLRALIEEHKTFRNYHENVELYIKESDGIAFDHAKIITQTIKRLRSRIEMDAKVAFDLMPEEFTLTQLQSVFEVVLDKDFIKPNFRRKIANYVVETDKILSTGGHRPSKLFIRNIESFKVNVHG